MELCTNSLQVGGDSELCTFLQEIVDGQLDLRDSQNHQHLTKLQQKAPIIASFLTGLSKPPVQVYNVLCELVAVIDATFQHADAMTQTLPQVTTHHL